jgi:6-phosphogluconolactonase
MTSKNWRIDALFLLGCMGHLLSMGANGISTEASDRIYIGTYTGAKSRGIYMARFDEATGKLSAPQLAAECKNPTFLAIHPKQGVLYAVNEVNDFGGKEAGAVSAFTMDSRTGELTLVNQQPTGGAGPCHLAVDPTGKCVLVANYGSGSVAALPVGSNGSLGEPSTAIQHHGSSVNPQRQAGPHAHFITPDPQNRFALCCDLGLDQVLVYRFDPAKGMLAPNEPNGIRLKAGSGPRHLAFSPNRRTVYVLTEMGSTLESLAYDARRGTLTEEQTVSTLPPEFKGNSTCAEVQVHPSGRFVYVSNRGDDSIAVFASGGSGNALGFVQRIPTGGRTPRHFALAPGGKWLLAENQDSDSVVVFGLDPNTGWLTPTGNTAEIGAPVCIVFVP